MSDNNIVDSINAMLAGLKDPGTGTVIGELNLVRDLQVDNGVVSLTFRPSSCACPAAFTIAPQIKSAIDRIDGVKSVKMKIENFKNAEILQELLAEG